MTTDTKLMRGAQVITADGQELGVVGEVMDDAFQVEMNMKPEYWLPRRCIASADAVAVRLECSRAEALGHHLSRVL